MTRKKGSVLAPFNVLYSMAAASSLSSVKLPKQKGWYRSYRLITHLCSPDQEASEPSSWLKARRRHRIIRTKRPSKHDWGSTSDCVPKHLYGSAAGGTVGLGRSLQLHLSLVSHPLHCLLSTQCVISNFHYVCPININDRKPWLRSGHGHFFRVWSPNGLDQESEVLVFITARDVNDRGTVHDVGLFITLTRPSGYDFVPAATN
jgi:hypothetical protein